MKARGLGMALAAAAALLAGCGGSEVQTGDGDAHGARILRYEVDSRYVRRSLDQVAIRPADAAARPPLLVFLHGRGGNGAESNVKEPFLEALDALGRRAPAVVFPDGGDHSYWHDRGDGRWGAYVLREVIPEALKRLDADPRRVAIGGISMGGFGAFDVAFEAPRHFCAVGGHSPAIFPTAGATAPGAFDGAADFARHDVIARARAGRPAPALWIDTGDRDPFLEGDRALAAALGIRARISSGGHDGAYWDAHYDDYVRFYARALASC